MGSLRNARQEQDHSSYENLVYVEVNLFRVWRQFVVCSENFVEIYRL